MIEIKGSIVKKDIPVIGSKVGLGNSQPITADGVTYAIGTLIFDGFYGLKNVETGLWDGVLRFHEEESAEAYQFSFTKFLAGAAPKKSTKRTKESE